MYPNLLQFVKVAGCPFPIAACLTAKTTADKSFIGGHMFTDASSLHSSKAKL